MIIQHNMPAINGYRNLNKNKGKLSKTLEKLSSGYRINRSGDDAAGLAISEQMRGQIKGIDQAMNNVQDGIGLINTADGAMEEISAMLQRAYTLCTQSANGTYGDSSGGGGICRETIQDEIDQIKDEISRIRDCTEFNGVYVLQGKADYMTEVIEYEETRMEGPAEIRKDSGLPQWVGSGGSIQDGYMSEFFTTNVKYEENGIETSYPIQHSGATLDFSALDDNFSTRLGELVGKGFYSTCCTCSNHYSIQFVQGEPNSMEVSGSHYIYKISVDSVNDSKELINAIIDGTGGNVAAGLPGNPNFHFTKIDKDPNQPGVLWVYDNRSSDRNPVSGGSGGTWKDWDGLGRENFGISANEQNGKFGEGIAEKGEDIVIRTEVPRQELVKNGSDLQLQIGPAQESILDVLLPKVTLEALGITDASADTLANANEAMEAFEHAIDYLSGERGRMGAYVNRLEHTYASLGVDSENLTQAESRIRDADMAEMMVEFTKENILLQASQAMLSQANAVPQNILQLLQ